MTQYFGCRSTVRTGPLFVKLLIARSELAQIHAGFLKQFDTHCAKLVQILRCDSLESDDHVIDVHAILEDGYHFGILLLHLTEQVTKHDEQQVRQNAGAKGHDFEATNRELSSVVFLPEAKRVPVLWVNLYLQEGLFNVCCHCILAKAETQ